MAPQAAWDFQIERYRAMSAEERPALALDLHALARDIPRAGIRAQHSKAAEQEVD